MKRKAKRLVLSHGARASFLLAKKYNPAERMAAVIKQKRI